MRRHARSGVALLEVLVALAVLTAVGLPLTALAGAALREQGALTGRDETLTRAESAMITTVLLSRIELDQRLGHHEVEGFAVDIQRPEPELYRIGIAERSMADRELLVTVVYRPRTSP
jgi:hypothetical protein